jgi:soluble lytic murein transglycosylase-like protein
MGTMRSILILLILCGPALAGEYAVLSSGARLHALRHETVGTIVRLYTSTGTTEIPASQVTGFEQEDYTPPPAPAESAAAPAPPVRQTTPGELVEAAARRHGLPPAFVRSVVAAESAFSPSAVSPKGAVGLMQLMPGTAKLYGVDANVPEQNVDAGARYLRDLLLKYRDDPYQVRRALAAYNAGPGAVDKYDGIPPYRETQTYVDRVLQKLRKNSANGQ